MKDTLLTISFAFYGLSCLISLVPSRIVPVKFSRVLFTIGVVGHALSSLLHYASVWPLMPMYQGPSFTALFLALAVLTTSQESALEYRLAVCLVVFLAACFVLWRKDYYLPFLHSKTPFSHIFTLSASAGKALFFYGAVKAASFLKFAKKPSSGVVTPRFAVAVIFGCFLWSLAMFSGELWSYLGWGTPIVWDDPAVLGMVGLWFFYACFLHLHLTKQWTAVRRALMSVVGAVLTFFLGFLPELGAVDPSRLWRWQ